eukprot:COSAG02_NODE_2245_length_9390_cov_30.175869_4_plen_486_part_00
MEALAEPEAEYEELVAGSEPEPEYEEVVARIDQTLGLLQRALLEEGQPTAGSGDGSAPERRHSVASPVRSGKRSPKQRRRRQQQQPGSSRRGGAPKLDASAYATAHASPRPTRRSVASPPRQLRSPRGERRSVGDGEYENECSLEERQPSFGTSAGRFPEPRAEGPGPAMFFGSCDAAAAQRTFGTLVLASPERRRNRLGSPSRSARVASPSRSARVTSPSRSARVTSPSRSARVTSPGAADHTDMIASWWEGHRALANELWGPGNGTDPSDRALGPAHLGLYGVLRRTAVRAHVKLSSAVVGSLNPGAVIEVLEARVLMRGGHKGSGQENPRVHVRLRSRYGKSSMAICGWAPVATPGGHRLLEKLSDGGQDAAATTVTVKKSKKKQKKKKAKNKRVVVSTPTHPGVVSSASDGSLSGVVAQHAEALLSSHLSHTVGADHDSDESGHSGNVTTHDDLAGGSKQNAPSRRAQGNASASRPAWVGL